MTTENDANAQNNEQSTTSKNEQVDNEKPNQTGTQDSTTNEQSA
jgi:hypothetical protein